MCKMELLCIFYDFFPFMTEQPELFTRKVRVDSSRILWHATEVGGFLHLAPETIVLGNNSLCCHLIIGQFSLQFNSKVRLTLCDRSWDSI